ncbi:MAG: hypothetical protein IKX36_01365, partial [Prevotella sp.]|nr:hypothetical protein [Prevotella sp.]
MMKSTLIQLQFLFICISFLSCAGNSKTGSNGKESVNSNLIDLNNKKDSIEALIMQTERELEKSKVQIGL